MMRVVLLCLISLPVLVAAKAKQCGTTDWPEGKKKKYWEGKTETEQGFFRELNMANDLKTGHKGTPMKHVFKVKPDEQRQVIFFDRLPFHLGTHYFKIIKWDIRWKKKGKDKPVLTMEEVATGSQTREAMKSVKATIELKHSETTISEVKVKNKNKKKDIKKIVWRPDVQLKVQSCDTNEFEMEIEWQYFYGMEDAETNKPCDLKKNAAFNQYDPECKKYDSKGSDWPAFKCYDPSKKEITNIKKGFGRNYQNVCVRLQDAECLLHSRIRTLETESGQGEHYQNVYHKKAGNQCNPDYGLCFDVEGSEYDKEKYTRMDKLKYREGPYDKCTPKKENQCFNQKTSKLINVKEGENFADHNGHCMNFKGMPEGDHCYTRLHQWIPNPNSETVWDGTNVIIGLKKEPNSHLCVYDDMNCFDEILGLTEIDNKALRHENGKCKLQTEKETIAYEETPVIDAEMTASEDVESNCDDVKIPLGKTYYLTARVCDVKDGDDSKFGFAGAILSAGSIPLYLNGGKSLWHGYLGDIGEDFDKEKAVSKGAATQGEVLEKVLKAFGGKVFQYPAYCDKAEDKETCGQVMNNNVVIEGGNKSIRVVYVAKDGAQNTRNIVALPSARAISPLNEVKKGFYIMYRSSGDMVVDPKTIKVNAQFLIDGDDGKFRSFETSDDAPDLDPKDESSCNPIGLFWRMVFLYSI